MFSSQGTNIALIVNCSITLSTVCLIVLIIAFHYKDIRVSLTVHTYVLEPLTDYRRVRVYCLFLKWKNCELLFRHFF